MIAFIIALVAVGAPGCRGSAQGWAGLGRAGQAARGACRAELSTLGTPASLLLPKLDPSSPTQGCWTPRCCRLTHTLHLIYNQEQPQTSCCPGLVAEFSEMLRGSADRIVQDSHSALWGLSAGHWLLSLAGPCLLHIATLKEDGARISERKNVSSKNADWNLEF